mgnify:CR=1 FL=1
MLGRLSDAPDDSSLISSCSARAFPEPLRMSAYCVAAQTSQSLHTGLRGFDLRLVGELDDLHRFGEDGDFFAALLV